MKRNRYIRYIALALALTTVAACSIIDEDLDDCETEHQLVYDLRLITNLSTELTTQLDAETDQWVEAALRKYLSSIFTDYAHDVDLSFFDVTGDSSVLHHEEHIMDANQTSYTLYLPVMKYMHTAVANVKNNSLISIRNNEFCHKGSLWQTVADTLTPHTTGVFSARLPMDVLENMDQKFYVHLYMVNCASALVIDTTGMNVRNIEVFTTGFATDYHIADSAYSFVNANSTAIHADRISVEQGKQICYCSVNYPSPETPIAGIKERSRLIFETTEPFLADNAADALWQYQCYVTLNDGSVTRTILYMKKPIRAGQLKVVKAYIDAKGVIRTNTTDVMTAITFNWKDGLVIE